MRMVIITYNEAFDAEVMDALGQLGIAGYTKWTGITGSGRSGGPHLMSHVWYKGNNALMTCVEDRLAEALMNRVREMRSIMGLAGIKAFSLPVSDVTC